MKQALGTIGTIVYRLVCWGCIALALALALLNLAFRGLLLFDDRMIGWASQGLGVPVEANVETTRWLGSRPQFFVSQLEVGEDDLALRVDEVVAEPNILQSLLTLSPSWQELRLTSVDMLIQEQAGGGWQIAGIDLAASGASQATSLEKMLLSSRRILLENVNARLQFFSGTEISMQLSSAEIENSRGFHRLVASAQLAGDTNQLDLAVELTGHSNRFSDLDGLAYASFRGENLTETFVSLLNPYSNEPLEISNQPGANAEVWANIHSGSRAEFQGYLEVSDMPGQIFSEELEDLYFRSDISGHFFYFEDELAIDFVQPDFSSAKMEWPLSDFRVTRSQGAESSAYSIQMQSLDLEELTQRVTELYALPDKIISIASDLDLSGQFENIEISLESSVPTETLLFSADLKSVDADSYLNAPAVQNLNGRINATADGGTLLIDSDNLSLHYPALFDWWIDHGSVEAELDWTLNFDENLIRIFGKEVIADSPGGLITGAFLVETGFVPREGGMDLELAIGVKNADAEDWPTYLPIRANALLQNWLQNAYVKGQVPASAIVYRGKVSPGTQDYRSIQLRFEAEQAEAKFLEGWPEITDINADIRVSNRLLNIQSSSAELASIQLRDIGIDVNAFAEESSLDLALTGVGETDAMLNLVRETGLRNRVGDGLDQLSVQGDSQFRLALVAPLKKGLALEEVNVDLSLELEKNQLVFQGQNIQFEELDGTLIYNEDGISAEEIAVSLWGEPFDLSIREERDLGVLNLFANGAVSVDALAEWLNIPSVNGFSGKSEVEALLQLNTDIQSEKPNRYLFLTDMVGIESTLPGELAKQPEEETELRLVIETTDQQDVQIEWDKGLKLGLRKPQDGSLPQGVYESAVLSYNHNTPAHQPGKLIGRFQQEETDADEWLTFLSQQPEEPNPAGSDLEGIDEGINIDEQKESVHQTSGLDTELGMLMGLKPDLLLRTQQLVYENKKYGELEFALTSDEVGWLCGFSNDVLGGDYSHPYEEQVIPRLRLNELNADALEDFLLNNALAEAATAFDPRTVPATDVVIENLTVGGESKGSWSAELRPSENGLSIDNIQCAYRSLDCGPGGTSSLYWAYSDDGQYSALSLDLNFEDISDVFTLASIDPPLTSTTGNFYASVNWNEAPHRLHGSPVSGVLGVDLQDGVFSAQAGGVGAGVVRLVSLVNIRTWLRRLRLDFSDLASDGTPYDDLGGDFTINQNVVNTLTPVIVGLPSGRLLIDGAVDIEQNEVDAQLVVTLPARQNMAWIAALAGGLPAAVGVWAVSKIFDDQLDSLASVSYQVTGPLDDPKVQTDRVFEATVQEQ